MGTALYKIGEVYIEISKPDRMPIPQNMQKFLASDVKESIDIQMKYILEYTDDILICAENLLKHKVDGKEAIRDRLHVFQTEYGECRIVNLAGDTVPYAVSLMKDDEECRIWVDEQYGTWLELDTVFMAMLSMEKVMLAVDAMILHSAYMCYKDKAVLFSAPSETGKSTQANLWEKYRGTQTVNGDRSLLICKEDGWRAYGWPVCGSSKICKNENYPIRAIVMLRQAKENKVYRLTGFQAMRELMEQITINAWDRDFQLKIMDELELMLCDVPIYRLECNISEEAVRCLESVLG